MRPANSGSVAYAPGVVPENSEGMRPYLADELGKISAAIQLLAAGQIDKSYSAPAKPRDGMIRLADGTRWNPGSGAGVYCYRDGAWRFLG